MRDYYLASKNAETLKEFLNRPELAEIECFIPALRILHMIFSPSKICFQIKAKTS